MRFLWILTIVLAPSACVEPQPGAEGCALRATHALTWSDPAAPDLVTASAEGETCADATVRLSIANAGGDHLWTMESAFPEMVAAAGAAAGDAPATREEVQTFLTSWADVTVLGADKLPVWRGSEDGPGQPGLHATPLQRAAYEAMRAANAPTMCAAVSVARTECFVFDPASRQATLVLATGA